MKVTASEVLAASILCSSMSPRDCRREAERVSYTAGSRETGGEAQALIVTAVDELDIMSDHVMDVVSECIRSPRE